MPSFARRILIFAAVDGLILQPAPPRNHKPTTDQAIKVEYRSSKIGPLRKDRRDEEYSPHILDSHGIVGVLKIASSSYLVSINAREQVAHVHDRPIYSISDIALIPLSSQTDAEQAITRARQTQRKREISSIHDDSSSDESDSDVRGIFSPDDAGSLPTTPPPEEDDSHKDLGQKRKTSVAEDVISRKGMYGRFTDRWFSKKGWNTDAKRNQGINSEEDLLAQKKTGTQNPTLAEAESTAGADPAAVGDSTQGKDNTLGNKTPKEVPESAVEDAISLLPKILTITKLLFGSNNFYFSYDYDLSRNVTNQPPEPNTLPLHRSFDSLFFWNRHLAAPFISAGHGNFILPIIQGFVGQRAFTIDQTQGEGDKITHATSDPEEVIDAQGDDTAQPAQATDSSNTPQAQGKKTRSFVLTIISRRSIKRAGLRYLRRGIDEEGNVANSVETEQILSEPDWSTSGGHKIYSFLQYRGSIPLFFSQEPYSLKPVVNFSGSPEANALAFRMHMQQLSARYGKVQAVSLVDNKNNEGKIGNAYEKAAEFLNTSGGVDGKGTPLSFYWFDFHGVCKGMKFENVSQLYDKVGGTLKEYSWTEEQDGTIVQKQKGVMRTNCMDCLDRTNVVQSATARNTLEAQLADQGITIDLNADMTTSWFNNVWADNGDAISRQYAGTAALKGDFTRTRKRNITGALNDLTLTLTRYYNNIVNDYFAQAVIDYLLGTTTEASFIDFEADMKAQDYAVDLRKVRQNAIDTCQKICVEDKEDLISGWTLSCPPHSNSLRSLPFQECVLLLTAQALYFCRMDWSTEKVKEFERIELNDVQAIAKGVYITSAVAKRDLDETRNVGFVIRIGSRRPQLVRVNTRSLANEKDEHGEKHEHQQNDPDLEYEDKDVEEQRTRAEGGEYPNTKVLAFKALPAKSSLAVEHGDTETQISEVSLIQDVTDKVALAVNKLRRGKAPAAPLPATSVQEGTANDGRFESLKILEVEDKDIISVADAKRSTGYLEQLGYSLKKLVWAT